MVRDSALTLPRAQVQSLVGEDPTGRTAWLKKKQTYANIYLIYALTLQKDKCQNISSYFLQGVGI